MQEQASRHDDQENGRRSVITDFFSNFSTAFEDDTLAMPDPGKGVSGTQAKMINPARIEIMTKEGNTTPSVATMPPNQPRCF